MARKTVCIVGAGPSGLVAAKTLLCDPRARGQFRVTVVESQPRIGGLWPSSPDDAAGMLHPHMLANQSRHTVQFSDLAWTAPGGSPAGKGSGDAGGDDDQIPEFPRAWQVGQYLQTYYQRYCAGRDDCEVQLGRRVVAAEPVEGGRAGWRVATQPAQQEITTTPATEAAVFDYLIVASGYFGSPAVPSALQPAVCRPPGGDAIPVIHSSQYRDLQSLFAGRVPRGKILVVGGQFSGVEIAGTIATHVASARSAPVDKAGPVTALPDPAAVSVHHLIQRPYWVFPLHTSPAPAASAPPFLPFDLTSYNLLKRPQPLADSQGHISVEAARRSHALFRTALGTDQADVHPDLAIRGDDVLDAPPYIAVSDTYLEHVRQGLIGVSKGRLEGVTGTAASTTAGTIDDVAAVVLATGFSAATSLSFFPESVNKILQLDPTDARQVTALAFHSTHHPHVPRLAFVGYYRSPYWGVMEMQARLATALFVEDALATASPAAPAPAPAPPTPWYPAAMTRWPRLAQALVDDRSIQRTLDLRANPQRASQFPMGDYLYLMNSFAEALGLSRRAGAALSTADVDMDIVTPAAYVDAASAARSPESAAEAARSLAATRAVASAGLNNGRFVARAVFRSLLGTWQLDRTLTSRLPLHPSGRFVGTAEFRLRSATQEGLSDPGPVDRDELEYLYVEDGMFTATSGPSFRATRHYIWRYDTQRDRLSVWFVRTDDSSRADYLFHALEFKAGSGQAGTAASGLPDSPPWEATAGHLCIDDFYDVYYNFAFSGVQLKDWRLRYTVRGPKKDYTIAGSYRRESSTSERK